MESNKPVHVEFDGTFRVDLNQLTEGKPAKFRFGGKNYQAVKVGGTLQVQQINNSPNLLLLGVVVLGLIIGVRILVSKQKAVL